MPKISAATTPPIGDWNPCATCNCGGWCFARCCIAHTDREHTPEACTAGSMCCPQCPERWHPDHPEGVDCAQTQPPPPPVREPPPTTERHVDPVSLAYRVGIRRGVEEAIAHLAEAGEPAAATALRGLLRRRPDLGGPTILDRPCLHTPVRDCT